MYVVCIYVSAIRRTLSSVVLVHARGRSSPRAPVLALSMLTIISVPKQEVFRKMIVNYNIQLSGKLYAKGLTIYTIAKPNIESMFMTTKRTR